MKLKKENNIYQELLKLIQEELMDYDEFAVRAMPSVKLERTHKEAVLPGYAKSGDAGADVRSVTETVIQPGARALLDLGFKIEIEDGWEIQVRPRSGLALKKGVTVLNSPGTIDSGYRGQCGVILQNNSNKPFPVRVGDRVAQFVLKRAPQAKFAWTKSVSASERGEGGFGSTGVK
jgi:dUTP pyrophosphatase